MEKRLGPTFHRTFGLISSGVAQVLRLGAANPSCTKELLAEQTTLGPEQVNSVLRYAYGTRLLDASGALTTLGQFIFEKDPTLADQRTLWLLHYNLCASNSLAPAFWGQVVSTAFRPETELSTQTVTRLINEFYLTAPQIKFNGNSAQKCASVLLGTYSDHRGLGSLGILRQITSGQYFVSEPHFPPLGAFAYILADFWEANLSETVTAHFSTVTQQLCPILLTSSSVAKNALGELQGQGLARVQQRTAPYQIEKLWTSKAEVLRKLYD
jgi:hypothetical protein